ncbi:hypothetical protein DSCO28_55680 [Desulfosarcina ovata subsp. sediminis]|uniref:Lipoprotein n=1 Tax=Desulfosarcina ovata subsp. sediminis TaxID=885957 RepID=A0A5K7ZXM6_9BACT|nr:hypothetical protein [Desulfosarcina ovata]BBO85002.1 hypothetical protein DSCO28_55680 [Desulfosarcina ovata subsp. sediminis]
MNSGIKLFIIINICAIFSFGCAKSGLLSVTKSDVVREAVMTDGMKICAINMSGSKICVEADGNFTRYITWDGVTRNVIMVPRKKRWYGKLGLLSSFSSSQWKYHNGVTRGNIEEAQIHFQRGAF